MPTRSIAESVFLTHLIQQIREQHIDLDATAEALHRTAGHVPPSKTTEAKAFMQPLMDILLPPYVITLQLPQQAAPSVNFIPERRNSNEPKRSYKHMATALPPTSTSPMHRPPSSNQELPQPRGPRSSSRTSCTNTSDQTTVADPFPCAPAWSSIFERRRPCKMDRPIPLHLDQTIRRGDSSLRRHRNPTPRSCSSLWHSAAQGPQAHRRQSGPPWPVDWPYSAAEDLPTPYFTTSANYTQHCPTYNTMPTTSNEPKPFMPWDHFIWQPYSTFPPPLSTPNNGVHALYSSRSTQTNATFLNSLPPTQFTSSSSSIPTTHNGATTNMDTAM